MAKISPAIAVTLFALGSAAPAIPQEARKSPALVADIYACRELSDRISRLDCFDRTVAALATAEGSKQIVIVDREEMREARKGMFGFALPRIRLFDGHEDKEAELSEITAPLDRAVQLASGRWVFFLADGARWEQTDGVLMLTDPRRGDSITIKRGPLGNYIAKIAGQPAFRIKRAS